MTDDTTPYLTISHPTPNLWLIVAVRWNAMTGSYLVAESYGKHKTEQDAKKAAVRVAVQTGLEVR